MKPAKFPVLLVAAFAFFAALLPAADAPSRSAAIVMPVTADVFADFADQFRDELKADNIQVAVVSAEGVPTRFGPSVQVALLRRPSILVTIGSQITETALGDQFAAELPPTVAASISNPSKSASLVRIGLEPIRSRAVAIVSDSPKQDLYSAGAKAIRQVLGPGAKKIGLLYNEGEGNSKNTAFALAEPLAKDGHEILRATITSPADLERACASLLLQGADLIVIPHDKVAVAQAATVVKMAEANRDRPALVFALDAGTVKVKGAHFGISTDYGELGRITARLAREILAGRDPAAVPILSQESATLCFNQASMDRVGTKIPADLAKTSQVFHGR